tara:strand:+ start:887 stop:1654 length:768 start_codon:yes stop_codon:yes gene_type:complete
MAYDPTNPMQNYPGSTQTGNPIGSANPYSANPYAPSWYQTPAGGTPPASWQSAEDFLSDFADINVTGLDEESRIFLPDPGQMQQRIGQARSNLGFDMRSQALTGQQNLLGMTGGQGLAGTMGSGFGRSQYGQQQAVGQAGTAYRQGVQQGLSGYKSDVLQEQYRYQDALTSALGNLLASGEDADLKVTPGGVVDPNAGAPTTDPDWNPYDNPQYGDSYEFQGRNFYWDGSSWINQLSFDQLEEQGDGYDPSDPFD